MRQAWAPRHPHNNNMPKTRIQPHQPRHPTIRELMEGRGAGTDDGGIFLKGVPGEDAQVGLPGGG